MQDFVPVLPRPLRLRRFAGLGLDWDTAATLALDAATMGTWSVAKTAYNVYDSAAYGSSTDPLDVVSGGSSGSKSASPGTSVGTQRTGLTADSGEKGTSMWLLLGAGALVTFGAVWLILK